VAKTSPPVFFVSYARLDTEYPDYREKLEKFVADLSAKVAVTLVTPLEGVSFMDSNVQAGELWSDSIGDALTQCRVGLALYSPGYFTREWCGKEFQVLLDRSRPAPGGTGIVPVRWAKKFPDPPECAARHQHNSGAFPPEYASMGMYQLVALRSVYQKQYEFALEELADRIVIEARAQRLAPLANVDFDNVRSAWDASTAADPQSHTRGNISKTCFVYASRSGWDWAPYQGPTAQIGALAQKITGDLGLRYEEIPYNASLSQKLKEANENDVPIVLFGDPTSLALDAYAQPMKGYDSQYLLNCAALVAWEPNVKDTVDTDQRWIYIKTKVCKQKANDPPPFHEWRSIFSQEDLDQKTRALIEQIRSRLMKQLVSDPNAGAKKMEAPEITKDAASRGIDTSSISNLGG